MKRAFSDMVGNEALRSSIASDILLGSLSHAYILEGAEGLGKHMLAIRIAAALACEHRHDSDYPLPCLACPSCKKILSGNSPDVIFVGRGDKATLGVEAIRKMQSDVFVAPNELDCKIYVIEDAHLLTLQAQNAFLLTLEEPPAYVRFLLLCESSANLLETVRSRAPVLRLEPIPPERIGEELCRTDPTAKKLKGEAPEEFSELLISAGGSIGRAKALLDPKKRKPILEQRAHVREFVSLCASNRNSAAVLSFLNSLGPKREDLLSVLGVMLLCLRDLLLCKQTEAAPLCFFADREEAISLSCKFSAPELLRLCDAIAETADRLRANANVRLTLTAFAMSAGILP